MEDYSMLSHTELGSHMYEVGVSNKSELKLLNLVLIISHCYFRLRACMTVTMTVVLCVQLLMVMAWTGECLECHLVVIIYHHLLVLELQCVTPTMYSHAAHHCPQAVHRKLKLILTYSK